MVFKGCDTRRRPLPFKNQNTSPNRFEWVAGRTPRDPRLHRQGRVRRTRSPRFPFSFLTHGFRSLRENPLSCPTPTYFPFVCAREYLDEWPSARARACAGVESKQPSFCERARPRACAFSAGDPGHQDGAQGDGQAGGLSQRPTTVHRFLKEYSFLNSERVGRDESQDEDDQERSGIAKRDRRERV